jgi:hypothetical protein
MDFGWDADGMLMGFSWDLSSSLGINSMDFGWGFQV